MDDVWKAALWRQLGAAIDMLDNAIVACPEEIWGDRSRRPEFWYLVYHTLFFLDLYLHGSEEGFVPPEPFTLDELDPAGILPERVYTQDEMRAYLRALPRKVPEDDRGADRRAGPGTSRIRMVGDGGPGSSICAVCATSSTTPRS